MNRVFLWGLSEVPPDRASVLEGVAGRVVHDSDPSCGEGFWGRVDCGWWVLEWTVIEVMRQGTPVEVEGLDAEWVLDLARDAELMARQAERAKLRAANRWADINAASVESGVEVWGNAGALYCEVPIGGPGTPALAAFSAEPFGAALGISTISAMNLISVAVELKHRLPGLWALIGGVGGGGVEADDDRPPHQSPVKRGCGVCR